MNTHFFFLSRWLEATKQFNSLCSSKKLSCFFFPGWLLLPMLTGLMLLRVMDLYCSYFVTLFLNCILTHNLSWVYSWVFKEEVLPMCFQHLSNRMTNLKRYWTLNKDPLGCPCSFSILWKGLKSSGQANKYLLTFKGKQNTSGEVLFWISVLVWNHVKKSKICAHL